MATGVLTPTSTVRWLPAVVVPYLLAALLLAVLGTDQVVIPEAVLSRLGWAGLLVLCLLALAGAALLVRRGRSAQPGERTIEFRRLGLAIGVVAVFIILTSTAGLVPPLSVWGDLRPAWQSKIIDLLWVGALFVVLTRWARREAGFALPRRGSWRGAMIISLALFAGFAGLTALAVVAGWTPAGPVSTEQLLFDATIPNLTEELIWRGAMLAVLDRAFGTPWRVAGAQLGWGVVITAVVFGVGHLILVDGSTGAWSVSLGGGLFATVMGLLLGWIRARTGSVWPAFVAHCAPELGVDAGMLVAG